MVQLRALLQQRPSLLSCQVTQTTPPCISHEAIKVDVLSAKPIPYLQAKTLNVYEVLAGI